MQFPLFIALLASLALLPVARSESPASAPTSVPARGREITAEEFSARPLRIATFNIEELTAQKIHAVDKDGHGDANQLRSAAAILQEIRPDIVLINEIDFDEERRSNAGRFMQQYLAVPQMPDGAPLHYDHIFFAPVNTGVPSGHDLNNDGKTDGPDDGLGFGKYPGQYGMAIYSRFPFDSPNVRTFQKFLWKDMPRNLMPDGTNGKPAWYSPEEVAILRLSSKSHWDVPVKLPFGRVLHLLASHPTPPVFDGPEDRNGRRNFDEIRLWADYLTGGDAASYIVDDQGRTGGLAADAEFVILGDLNADPALDKERPYGRTAISQLMEHPRVQPTNPQSEGGGANMPKRVYPGELGLRTADFGRADYVLPSKTFTIHSQNIFWPLPDERGALWVGGRDKASDHRLVWIEVK